MGSAVGYTNMYSLNTALTYLFCGFISQTCLKVLLILTSLESLNCCYARMKQVYFSNINAFEYACVY